MLDDMVNLRDWDLSKMLGNKCRWNSLVSQIRNNFQLRKQNENDPRESLDV